MNTKQYKGYELFPVTQCQGRKVCVQIRVYKNGAFKFETPMYDRVSIARINAQKTIDNSDTNSDNIKNNPMNMNNPTYEQRVRAIAEEMGFHASGHLAGWNDEIYKAHIIEISIPFARIAVKHISEAYKEGWRWGYEDGIDTEGNHCYDRKKKMIEWGLIPDADKEAVQDAS